MSGAEKNLNLLSWTGKIKILHMTWMAFFITFYVWFNHAPLLSSIQETFGLSRQELKALLILNVALTIPARIITGMLVDRFGPRITYSSLLFVFGIPCLMFAFAETYNQLALARFLMGGIGAGFVIGIRMVGEWFPAKEVGVAEGIYGGWGNFGSAAAALSIPAIALAFGGDEGWRYAIALTGLVSMIYSFVYYKNVTDTPKGMTYFKPKKNGALEVTSKSDLIFYLVMTIPMYVALAVLTWKLSPLNLGLLSSSAANISYLILLVVYIYNSYKIIQVNKGILTKPVPEMHCYKFKQVAILNLAYFATFGSELAVVSMLPMFFMKTFDVSQLAAGLLASGFAFMNLVARPGGGLLSDKFGRKKTLLILLVGLAFGYYGMANINSGWSIPAAVITTMACSFFVQAGEGAVFAVVPLVKRRLTGQIAGMTGAYGNVGAVIYLTIFSFVDASAFFMIIAASSAVALVSVAFLEEPAGKTAEVMPDGSVQMIEVG